MNEDKELLELQVDIEMAKKMFEREGKIRPVVIATTKDNQQLYIPLSYGNDEEKQQTLFVLSMTFLAFDVVRYVHINEAWFTTHGKDENKEDIPRPSQDPRRKEAVIILLVTRSIKKDGHV